MIYSSKRIKKQQSFTLLEILIVITILGLIAGLIGVNMYKVTRQQKFQQEVDLVVNKLRLAQDLMLIFHGDVHVKFSEREDDKGIDLTLILDHEVPNPFSQQLQQPYKLTSIYSPYLDGSGSPIDIKFLSNGSVMTKGELSLSSSSSNRKIAITRYINLPGYPAPIYASTMPKENEASTLVFDEQLTLRTREEVQPPEPVEEEVDADTGA